jgi:glycosyltransferase involved in cell wall biosynthesis
VTQVSVLMPIFNAAETLHETIQSLLSQSHGDFEIIVVDDGSTDQTHQMLKQHASKDARVRPFMRKHQGIIPALNFGLEQCSGKYVARMDADDISLPSRLAQQAAFLEENKSVALVASLIEGFPAKEIRGGFQIYIEWLNSMITDDQIKEQIFVESPFAHPSVMFRKSAVEKLGGYEEHGWAEDYDLWLRMAQSGLCFAKIPEILVRWRDHPTRLTRSDSRYSLSNFLRAKAHYLMRGPMKDRDALIVWGAGMMGKRLSKFLLDEGAPLEAFIDVDPKKIGRSRRGKNIFAPDDLKDLWKQYEKPILLAAVGARGARKLIREKLQSLGFIEGQDWFAAA